MRVSELAGSLPQTSISFPCLEKISDMQERRQAGEDQQLLISTLSAVAEMTEIPKSDTSTVKTMTVLQRAQPVINIGGGMSNKNVDQVGSVQSSGNCDMNAYCENKLWSLSEGE